MRSSSRMLPSYLPRNLWVGAQRGQSWVS
jgi:hypothetical protein